jgi:hypothetical protein
MQISGWLNFMTHMHNEICNLILNEASQKLVVTFVLYARHKVVK